LVAPVLTYTADEIVEYAPKIFKGDMETIFDLLYEPLPEIASSLDERLLSDAREAFYEVVDRLKKEKQIKSTLELEIAGDVELFGVSGKDIEDWFVVSGVNAVALGEEIAQFTVSEQRFSIHKASAQKCPRCWRYTAASQEQLCERCSGVVHA
jgi:isoleucyl-tRNA synthetase